MKAEDELQSALREKLLTCDGVGRAVKEHMLDELIRQHVEAETAAKDVLIARLREALYRHECAARENLISARIIEAENQHHGNRNYAITRDTEFILKRTHAALVVSATAMSATESTAASELAELRRWKAVHMAVESWWQKIDDFIRASPDAVVGASVSSLALAWLQERAELRRAFDLQRANYIRLYEALLGAAGGTVVGDIDPLQVAAELRRDKERLDWLATHGNFIEVGLARIFATRRGIDEARSHEAPVSPNPQPTS